MKIKNLMVAMMAAIATATFTACSSDDDNNNTGGNTETYQSIVDNSVNTQKKSNKALLLVAFGSTWQKAFNTFDATVAAYKAAFPGYDVYMSFSSAICINRAAAGSSGAENRNYYAPQYWLESFGRAKYDTICVQSLQVIPGEEYSRVVNSIKDFANNSLGDLDDTYLSNVKLYLGTPLMATTDDVSKLAGALNGIFSSRADTAVVAFMGHGNPDEFDVYSANIRYTQLEDSLQIYSKNYYVGTVDMMDNFKPQVLARMNANGITSGSIYLQALMSIAGDHAHNDMAGDDGEDITDLTPNENGEVDDMSWKVYFTKNGFVYREVNADGSLDGLLDFAAVRQLWMNHTTEAINGEPLEYYHSKN